MAKIYNHIVQNNNYIAIYFYFNHCVNNNNVKIIILYRNYLSNYQIALAFLSNNTMISILGI